MAKNFKLIIEYDGTNYHGWQKQAGDVTVQETLETAIARMTGCAVSLAGSGRTDAGVHALGQVASFSCETRLGPADFVRGLNSLVPPDIVIRSCEEMPLSFHARKNAQSKIYKYFILNRGLPCAVGRQYAWHVRKPLDVPAMNQAASFLVGTHDFKAFEGAAGGAGEIHSTRRTLFRATVSREADVVTFTAEGNGFLRHMVRNIVGTLVETGMGKRPPADMRAVLESGDRGRAGPTAPAQGLFLIQVDY